MLNKEVPLLNQVLPIILPDLTFFCFTVPFQGHRGIHSVFQLYQVVDGLNKLHTTFGKIIDHYNVYNVETITDLREWLMKNAQSLKHGVILT